MSGIDLIAEPGKQEVVITRVFDAPRELVFKTMTDPTLIPRWWGLRSQTTTVERMEVKPGGVWRFVCQEGGGEVYAFHGVYHESVPFSRLVFTFEFEGTPGHVLLETICFEDLDGRTKVIDQSVFQSVEDRDGMVTAGMGEGSSESMDRLAEQLAKLAVR